MFFMFIADSTEVGGKSSVDGIMGVFKDTFALQRSFRIVQHT